MNKSSAFLLCLLAFVPTAVNAGTAPAAAGHQRGAKAEAAFAASDRNGDGRLSYAEWQEARTRRLAEQFRKLDLNRDGALTQDEMRQAHQQRKQMRASHRQGGQAMREKMRALDRNGDRAFSRSELGTAVPKLSNDFDRIDSNRDGLLTREEIRASRAQLPQDAR